MRHHQQRGGCAASNGDDDEIDDHTTIQANSSQGNQGNPEEETNSPEDDDEVEGTSMTDRLQDFVVVISSIQASIPKVTRFNEAYVAAMDDFVCSVTMGISKLDNSPEATIDFERIEKEFVELKAARPMQDEDEDEDEGDDKDTEEPLKTKNTRSDRPSCSWASQTSRCEHDLLAVQKRLSCSLPEMTMMMAVMVVAAIMVMVI